MKKILYTLLCAVIICTAFVAQADAGMLNLSFDNESDYAWVGFHFFIFKYPYEVQFPFFDYEIENVNFIESPSSSQSPLAWEISPNGKKLDLFFPSDPVFSGETATFGVNIENLDGAMYGVGFGPVVVPEPVSSMLFIVGGAALGFRRMKKRVSV